MKPKKHFVDHWCEEQFIKFPFAPKEAKNFITKKQTYGEAWPDWCGLPMAATYAIITRYSSLSEAPKILAQHGEIALPELTAALLWSRSKSVYRFDPEFYAELTKETKIEKIPIEVLHQLPFHCVFIEAPATLKGTTAKGFFAWLELDTNSRVPELRLLFLFDGGHTTSIPLILSGGDIDDSFQSLFESAIKRPEFSEDFINYLTEVTKHGGDDEPEDFKGDIVSALNAVLYLCSVNANMECESFSRAVSVSTSKDKHGNPKKHRYWDIGVRFGKAFRTQRSKKNKGAEIGRDNKQTIHLLRPHIRRAHWHHFWTDKRGNDERKLVLRWIHPVFVGGDEDLPTVVHKMED